MSDKKIPTIPLSALVDLQISGAFYYRLQKLLHNFASQKTPEEFANILKNLKDKEPTNDYEYDFITLYSLLRDFEEAAQKQEKVNLKDPSEIKRA